MKGILWIWLCVHFINGSLSISLTPSTYAEEKSPGQSLTITCHPSGYSFSCCNIHWIRQAPGKGLEWLGRDDGSYTDNVRGRLSLNRDTSNSRSSMTLSNLKTEDTAVYYCARQYWSAFDYWGKGTMVTVSSGEKVKPSLFPLAACDSAGTSTSVTVGCLATGFTPIPVTFSWKNDGSTISDFIQYPSMQQGSSYSAVSQIDIKRTDWKNRKISCLSNHVAGNDEIALIPPPPPINQLPTLYVTIPSMEELKDNKTASFVCLAQQFSPEAHSIKWFLHSKEITNGFTTYPTTSESGQKGKLYSVSSYLRLTKDQWTGQSDNAVTCQFKNNKNEVVTKTVRPPAGDCNHESFDVQIIPPSPENLFLKDRVQIGCKVNNDDQDNANITWQDSNGNPQAGFWDPEGNRVMSMIISYDDWRKGKEFFCLVMHENLIQPKKVSYRRTNGGDQRIPKVFILGPAEHPHSSKVTLTCYATNFNPKEVLITWLVDDKPFNRTEFRTTDVLATGETYSVYSELVINSNDWKSGAVYSCMVHHETVPKLVRTINRSIDSVSNKPNLVSLDLNIPQMCKA